MVKGIVTGLPGLPGVIEPEVCGCALTMVTATLIVETSKRAFTTDLNPVLGVIWFSRRLLKVESLYRQRRTLAFVNRRCLAAQTALG
jgi:hypothetical protein